MSDGTRAEVPSFANEAGCFFWPGHVIRLDRVSRHFWGWELGMDLDRRGDVDSDLPVRKRLLTKQLRG